ncbi:IS1193, transposase, ISL3 family [Streptococcus infantarius subsp. infantarius]|nr:IS1193, transposase, ISL3 family [Streptococcus infantarius subsp. infantarius]MCO4606461.1 IS1193, transposase, ISL3 family [Streptococcus infantarius subsp. infantarius]
MEQLNLITNFLRIKDKNITITDEYDMGTHLELHGHLDYTATKCPSCKGLMAKYDFQKASKIPYLETAGYPLLIRLRKRRFKCKDFGKMADAETPLVKKNHQISVAVNQKIAQLLIEQEIATVNPIFQTVFKTFLKDKDKVLNAMELPYSNAKLEATNNLIKVIKRNAFGFRNFENFKKRILIA